LTFITNNIVNRLIALVAALTAQLMIPLELVPFAAALPALAIICLGLSVSTEDGLMTLVG
jgi:hypothetical protein